MNTDVQRAAAASGALGKRKAHLSPNDPFLLALVGAPIVVGEYVSAFQRYCYTCPWCAGPHESVRVGGARCPVVNKVVCVVAEVAPLDSTPATRKDVRLEQIRYAVFRRADGRCHYCGGALFARWTVDHVVPRSRGGTRALSNLVASCAACNLRKANFPVESFQTAALTAYNIERRRAGLAPVASLQEDT